MTNGVTKIGLSRQFSRISVEAGNASSIVPKNREQAVIDKISTHLVTD